MSFLDEAQRFSIPVVASFQGETKETTVPSYAGLFEFQLLLKPLFGKVLRMDAKHDGRDWLEVNDKDSWWIFRKHWWGLSKDDPIPTMELRLVCEEQEDLIPGAPTACERRRDFELYEKAFNADKGRRHTEGPFPWVQHEMLGKGAKGVVYKGQKDDGEWIAVKAVDISRQRASITCALELDLLNKVDHNNIVKLLGWYGNSHEEIIYIILEFMSKGSLRNLLERTKSALPHNVVQDYTRQITEGLVYLHSMGIAHRDVKAANILINDDDVLKLADFDVSKELPPDERDGGCHSLVGSPYWMSPELCQDRPYGVKTDIWALGCVMIEMLTAGLPWEQFSYFQMAVNTIAQSTGPPTNLPALLPEQMRSFVDRIFQHDPANRASADELQSHQYLQSSPAS
eukprot:GGOE01014901.1.p1 GENE.GGOE01014901.1~~GGOE01014901.1.p1  ORF type:complete len:399 (-),score=70.39 GGOE01014901.1:199-1395(-)